MTVLIFNDKLSNDQQWLQWLVITLIWEALSSAVHGGQEKILLLAMYAFQPGGTLSHSVQPHSHPSAVSVSKHRQLTFL